MRERVVVVAAVITPVEFAADSSAPISKNMPVLLSQRLEGKHLAGYWEFPGGQVEVGESEQAALSRELQEELGIRVHSPSPWCSLTHHYSEKTVILKLYRVSGYSGVPMGVEGQAIDWVPWKEVGGRKMPPADAVLLKLFGVSPYYLCSIEPLDHHVAPIGLDIVGRRMVSVAGEKSTRWPWLIQYPAIDFVNHTLVDRHKSQIRHLQSMGHACLYQGLPSEASALGTQGVHLCAESLLTLHERPADLSWVAASCHDHATIKQANFLGVDFVTLPRHLTTAEIEALIKDAEIPVFVASQEDQDGLGWSRDLGGFGVTVYMDSQRND